MGALRSNKMLLDEDSTVMVIKRKIADELLPESDGWSRIEMRTPSRILVGQDHTLRFIRAFLWPKAKGELILYYTQAIESLY
mmetsp:Transcript_22210/g.34812  ORF Transcript_22210/g.34812 Transcript_22210/m.34812 type:complete len:82 (+) Transcript_22210:778-1023(+)